jgi:hypothetical protein
MYRLFLSRNIEAQRTWVGGAGGFSSSVSRRWRKGQSRSSPKAVMFQLDHVHQLRPKTWRTQVCER